MIKKLLPRRVKLKVRRAITKIRIWNTSLTHKNLVRKIQKKDKIKIAFLLINESIWKYERLYFLLADDERFEPCVFICPFITYGEEIMQAEMDEIYSNFKEKGYNVRKTLQKEGAWLDIKKEFQPDLVFFSTPWQHSLPQYYILNFLDTLTCYVPYGFNSSNLYNVHYNFDMQNFAWRVFCESSFHKELALHYSPRKGNNFRVTGFPGVDYLIDNSYQAQDVWKPQNKPKKRIIWAPHHTIPTQRNLLDYSTFLIYAELMLQWAEEFQDEIQICFKPHPNLKGKLIEPEIWGKEKTEAYFNKWKTLSNGQIAEGDYIDLFLTSDAMIHDSGSFLFEYMFTKKPILFLVNNDRTLNQFNELGKEALTKIKLGYNSKEVKHFIQSTVIEGEDDYKEQRRKFVFDNLIAPNHKLASQNIIDEITKELR